MRRALALPCALVVVALASTAGRADVTPAPSYGTVLNILPPGTQGRMNAVEVAQYEATGALPAHFHDQLDMYDALNRPDPAAITDADLATKYYKDAGLGVDPADVVATETPRPGVTILRDRFGVPHIYGVTDEDTAYGAGYAGTEDRMFLQDTLRHVGAARAAEFLGPSPANIAMDAAQLHDADYTAAEAEAQVTNLPKRFGAEGERFVRQGDAFVAGINAAQHAALLDPTKLPAEYPALQIVPRDWTRADVIYVASLVGGRFGLGGGGEYANGLWLQRLTQKFGSAEGRKVFDDLRERDDPEAPVTIPRTFPYLSQAGVDPAAVVLPDLNAPTAPGAGSPSSSGPLPTLPPGASAPTRLDGPLGPIDLSGLSRHGMSNALLVAADKSANGHPTVVFGPQTGYFTPQLLTEVDLHGPGIAARGVSFAATQLIVELGRGRDYAWSATSASGDNTDQVFEKLCNVDGSAPTVNSTAYLVGSTCTPMTIREHQEIAKPSAGGQGAPTVVKLTVMRTRHGIVQLRTTAAGGVPVAVVNHRVTYGHELDSGIGFMRVNDPRYVHNARDFMKAFDGVDYTFNWFYADDRDIAYFESGLLPLRDPRVDPDLPSWGTGEYEWQGWLPFDAHPHAINPPAGFIANWNNKPAPGFAAADNEWGYGPVYRSQQLSRRIEASLANGPMTRATLVSDMIDAATADVRGTDVIPYALDVIGDDPTVAPYVAMLRSWIAPGAHRVDRDQNGAYDQQAAVALADEWYPSLAKDALRGTLGDLVDALPHGVDNHPTLGVGSSWNGVPWYGYLNKDLRSVLGAPVAGPYSRTYCGGGSPAQCRADLVASLSAAVTRLAAAQGADPAAWTYDKHRDDIKAVTVGIVASRNIDWQNRPTFQQVVSFTSHEPRRAGRDVRDGFAVAAESATRPLRLAATGLGGTVPWLAVLSGFAAVLAVRRRRTAG